MAGSACGLHMKTYSPFRGFFLFIAFCFVMSPPACAAAAENAAVVEISAQDSAARTKLINAGVDIISVDFLKGTVTALIHGWDRIDFGLKPEPPGTGGDVLKTEELNWQHYHSYGQIRDEVAKLCSEHYDICRNEIMGYSIRGLPIFGVKLSDHPEADEHAREPGMLIMGAIHAREHLTHEICLLAIRKFLDDYGKDPEITRLLCSRELWIFPIVNPDGVAFDWSLPVRGIFWRKNLRQNSLFSYGVDLNRNFGYRWDEENSGDNNLDPTYRGPSAFSEPETAAIRDFAASHPGLKVSISYHSFGKQILYPWGCADTPIENREIRETFCKMAQKMAEWTDYAPMQSSDLYVKSGDSDDWLFGERGIFAFTIEVDPLTIYEGGFYPPAAMINDVFNKNWPAILYALDKAENPGAALHE